MKRLSALFLALLFVFPLALPCAATDTVAPEEDDFTCVQSLTITPAGARTASRAATFTQDYYYKSTTHIATIAVTAVFRYTGSSVSVTSMTVSQHDTYNGWTWTQGSFTADGGTVTLKGKLTKSGYPYCLTKLVMTCDENGNIS